MAALTLASTISRAPSMIAADVEDSIVMLDVELGRYLELNPVASAIWLLIESPSRVSEIRDGLLSQFDVSSEQCEQALLGFLAEMIERGALIAEHQMP